ncbi:hypothetical protein ACFFRR_001658 [Megaselia abdita]
MDANIMFPVKFRDQFEVVWISNEYQHEAAEIIISDFAVNENLCHATELSKSSESLNEFRHWVNVLLEDSVTLGIRDTETNKLVSVCLNKILYKEENKRLEKIFETYRSKTMEKIAEVLSEAECTVDIYEKWDIEAVLEVIMMSTLNNYLGKGFAQELFKQSMKVAQKLASGNENDLNIPRQKKVPQAVVSLLTSLYTQKIFHKMNFEIIHEIPIDQLEYNGKKFSEVLDPMHKTFQYCAIKL